VKVYCEIPLDMGKRTIHKFVSHIKSEFNLKIISLEINFVKSDTILEINKQYLNHEYTTDIITFNYSKENDRLDGEIFARC